MSNQSATTLTADIRPEAELVLSCARTCVEPETAGRIRALLQQDLDWAHLLRLADLHGVAPLLYWNLSRMCPEEVPEAPLDQLQAAFRVTAERGLFLAGELIKLLERFANVGIAAIPLKGPVLAVSVYGHVALREFKDLDLLIRQQDAQGAIDLLLSEGYRPDPRQERRHDGNYHFGFVRDDGRVRVELHRGGVTPSYFPFPIDFDRLWTGCQPFLLIGTAVPNLAAEELLLILCVHGVKHCWGRLNWICDLAELIRARPELDWRRLMEQATALGSMRMLLLSLLLARDLLGAAVPHAVWQRVQADPVVRPLAKQVSERLFRVGAGCSVWLETTTLLRVRERFRDRVRHYLYLPWLLIAPSERDESVVPLPRWLSLFYYLIRPFRLAGKYGSILYRRYLTLRTGP